MPVDTFSIRLQGIQTLAPSVKQFSFVRTEGQPLAFEPGQFMTLLLPDATGGIKRRSYSLATAPGTKTLDIAVSYIPGGLASEYLFQLPIGAELNAMGPVGRLVLSSEPVRRYILIGTGTGIAPYHAMLPVLSQRLATGNTSVVIVQGVRRREDLLYANAFTTFAEAHERAQFWACYSREDTLECLPYECKGYVQTQFDALSLKPDQDLVYLCGNPQMIDAAFSALQANGFSSKSIRREKYISSN